MIRTHIALPLVLGAFLTAGMAASAAQSRAHVTMRAATEKETVQGDVRGAIALYEDVVQQAGSDRDLAARALLRMAEAYQKLGDQGAQRAYQRIVEQFADQTQIAAVARGRLGTSAAGTRARFEKVWDGDAGAGNISSTGRITFPRGPFPDEMMVHDLRTGMTRPITDEVTDGGKNALHGVISRDGSRVIYRSCGGKEPCGIRLVRVDMNTPQRSTVLLSGDAAFAVPMDWSPDGTRVALLKTNGDRTNQIDLLTVADASRKTLLSLDWRGSTTLRFSPDGSYLLYDQPASDAGTQRDVFAIAIDGSRRFPVAVHPAYDTAMGWSHDGRFVLFASDRSGARDLWRQAIVDGKPQGGPELAMPGLGNVAPLGVGPTGTLYVARDPGGATDIEVTSVDFSTGKTVAPARRPIARFVGSNSQPAWSADGKNLAYAAGFNTQNERALMIHKLDDGTDREIPLKPALDWFTGPTWNPKGHELAVIGADLKGRHGVFRINVETGAVTPVTHTTFAPPDNLSERLTYEGASWSPDGTRLYFHKAGGAIVEWNFGTSTERTVAEGNYGPIALSPDGRSIATYTPFNNDGAKGYVPRPAAVVMVPVGGGPAREVWQLDAGEWINNTAMAWTPDSQAVLVHRMRDSIGSKSELWLVPVAGGPPRKLDFDATKVATYAAGKIRMHPDGKQLAYQSPFADTSAVWMIENFIPPVK